MDSEFDPAKREEATQEAIRWVADNLPMLRDDCGHIHLNGLYRHGFLMAPALAEELAEDLAQDLAKDLARHLTATPNQEPAHAD